MANTAPTSYTDLAQVITHIPVLLAETRRARGLSIRAAAKQMGVSFSTVNRIEHGEDFHSTHIVAVLRWMDAR